MDTERHIRFFNLLPSLIDRTIAATEALAEHDASLPDASLLDFTTMWDGLPGLACGLLELSALVPDGTSRALSALKLILARAKVRLEIERYKPRHGLLGGQLGALLCLDVVAKRIGSGEDSEWIREYSLETMSGLCQIPALNADLAGGVAGSICTVKWASQRLGQESGDLIYRLGRSLLTFLERSPRGYLLYGPQIKSWGPVCGLAHGTTGAGVALIEAGVYLNDEVFKRIGLDCLEQEWQFMDRDRLWPDLRIGPSEAKSPRPISRWPLAYRSGGYVWCYGSCGIGLAHGFVAHRLGSTQHFLKYREVIQKTISALSCCKILQTEHGSICHGVGSFIGLLRQATTTPLDALAIVTRQLDYAEQILVTACEAKPNFERAFPEVQRLGRNPVPGKVLMRRWSYFLGVTGLAVVYGRFVRNVEQNSLLLPIDILA